MTRTFLLISVRRKFGRDREISALKSLLKSRPSQTLFLGLWGPASTATKSSPALQEIIRELRSANLSAQSLITNP